MEITILGSGTSHGIPVIACGCDVCRSSDSRDKRNRCGAYITSDSGLGILVDIPPEFRLQAIKFNVKKVDAVLLTHSHADHLHGIDDLRVFSSDRPNDVNLVSAQAPIPIHTNTRTAEDIKIRFSYMFRHSAEGGGHANITPVPCEKTFMLGGLKITPVPLMHGHTEATGWLVSEKKEDGTSLSAAYLTDCSFICDESFETIKQNSGILRHLVIDGLRIKPHSTHFSFAQALEAADRIGAEHTWLTHISHASSHQEIITYIEENISKYRNLSRIVKNGGSVSAAYDGLVIRT